MSEDTIENSTRVILTVFANSYGDSELLHQTFDSEGKVPDDWKVSGDTLAFAVAHEVADSFCDIYHPIKNLGCALQTIENMLTDLGTLRDGLLEHIGQRIIFDFLIWFRDNNRTAISAGLFKSWIDTHECEIVRALSPVLIKEFQLKDKRFAEHEGQVQLLISAAVTDFNLEVAIADQAKLVALKFRSPKDNQVPPPSEPPPPVEPPVLAIVPRPTGG